MCRVAWYPNTHNMRWAQCMATPPIFFFFSVRCAVCLLCRLFWYSNSRVLLSVVGILPSISLTIFYFILFSLWNMVISLLCIYNIVVARMDIFDGFYSHFLIVYSNSFASMRLCCMRIWYAWASACSFSIQRSLFIRNSFWCSRNYWIETIKSQSNIDKYLAISGYVSCLIIERTHTFIRSGYE